MDDGLSLLYSKDTHANLAKISPLLAPIDEDEERVSDDSINHANDEEHPAKNKTLAKITTTTSMQ